MKKTIFVATIFLFLYSLTSIAEAITTCQVNTTPTIIYAPVPEGNEVTISVDTTTVPEELRSKSLGGYLEYSFPDDDICGNPLIKKIESEDDIDNILNPEEFKVVKDSIPGDCDNSLLGLGHSVGTESPTERIHRVELIYVIGGQRIGGRHIGGTKYLICADSYKVLEKPSTCTVDVQPERETVDATFTLEIKNIKIPPKYSHLEINYDNGKHVRQVRIDDTITQSVPSEIINDNPGTTSNPKKHTVTIKVVRGRVCGSDTFYVYKRGEVVPTNTPVPTPNEDCRRCMITAPSPCECTACLPSFPECQPTPGPPAIDAKDICEQIEARCPSLAPTPQEQCKQDAQMCLDCFAKGGAWTALGCIKTDVGGFVRDLFRIILGVAGGIAFLLLLKGGFQIMFSRGDAEELAEGQQTITAAIAGLIFIFLAIFILKIIGVDILDLPGFGPD